MKKIPIVTSDYERILLTEVLPYELPIIFTNEWFYRQAKIGFQNVPPLIRVMLREKIGQETVPYGFSIRQGVSKKRHLALIHPAAQLSAVDLYRHSNQQICWLCSRSQYSVRYPAQIASYYYEKNSASYTSALKQDSVDTDLKSSVLTASHGASFFSYKDHSHLYKFLESSTFLAIEARFRLLLRFDIKRCFPSLYTHSISWAVKGKEFSKKYRGASSFEDSFDRIMRDANHGETNGIVVGPELSRIFAEIVLQRIDSEIAERLRSQKLSDKVQIKRYIDDYFVFGNEKGHLDAVSEVAQEVLQKYNLFMNEAKTELADSPFVTNQTIAKHEIKDELNSTILGWYREVSEICAGKAAVESFSIGAFSDNPERYSQILIKRLKISIRRNNATYEVVSGYFLGAIAKALFRLSGQKLRDLDERTKTLVCALLSATCEVCMFVYLMDIRVQSTYKVSQIILMIVRLSKIDGDFSRNVVSRIAQLSYDALKLQAEKGEFGPEILNLLVTTRAIDPDRLLTPEQLSLLLSSREGTRSWDYFRSISIIYYIRTAPEYSPLMDSILTSILARFQTQNSVENDTEALLLLMDVSSCPYVSQDWKEKIIEAASVNVLRRQPQAGEVGQLINYSKRHLSFTVWDAEVQLERLLRKKELTFTY